MTRKREVRPASGLQGPDAPVLDPDGLPGPNGLPGPDRVFQPPPIMGYRDLTERDIDRVNSIKMLGNTVSNLIASLTDDPAIDKRWLAIAETDLQKGFMCLVRSVTKPTNF